MRSFVDSYALKAVRAKPSKKNPHVSSPGRYKCSDYRSQFTVRMGTTFKEMGPNFSRGMWLDDG
jgi:transposase-like protein